MPLGQTWRRLAVRYGDPLGYPACVSGMEGAATSKPFVWPPRAGGHGARK